MSVLLVSSTALLQVFLLPHGTYCAALGHCACSKREDGVRLDSAVTIPARAIVQCDRAVLQVPGVQRAIHAGQLRVQSLQSLTQPVSVSEPTIIEANGIAVATAVEPTEVRNERRATSVKNRRS